MGCEGLVIVNAGSKEIAPEIVKPVRWKAKAPQARLLATVSSRKNAEAVLYCSQSAKRSCVMPFGSLNSKISSSSATGSSTPRRWPTPCSPASPAFGPHPGPPSRTARHRAGPPARTSGNSCTYGDPLGIQNMRCAEHRFHAIERQYGVRRYRAVIAFDHREACRVGANHGNLFFCSGSTPSFFRSTMDLAAAPNASLRCFAESLPRMESGYSSPTMDRQRDPVRNEQ